MSASDLDRGLAEASGTSSANSELRVVERITSESPWRRLRDADSEQGAPGSLIVSRVALTSPTV